MLLLSASGVPSGHFWHRRGDIQRQTVTGGGALHLAHFAAGIFWAVWYNSVVVGTSVCA